MLMIGVECRANITLQVVLCTDAVEREGANLGEGTENALGGFGDEVRVRLIVAYDDCTATVAFSISTFIIIIDRQWWLITITTEFAHPYNHLYLIYIQ